MDLLIDTYGAFVGCTGERIVVHIPRGYGKKRLKKEYPICRLEKIVILRPSSISTHAVKLALEHEVDIVYLGAFGKPVGRIFASDPKGLATLRRAQLQMSTDPSHSLALAKAFVQGKCANQIAHLTLLRDAYLANVGNEILQSETILHTIEKVPEHGKSREQLLGIEGYIADKYFGGLKKLFKFPGRNPHGRDPFNSAMNYGYGILYNEMERACLYVGLDPWLGLYHTERYGKPALVLDLVEEFRVPVVDVSLIPLFINRALKKSDFERQKKNEYHLSPEGKAKVVGAVLTQLNKEVCWNGKRRPLKDVIEEQVRALARYFLGKSRAYTPFDFSVMDKRR
jgi:CRISPR-associated protein Cas1